MVVHQVDASDRLVVGGEGRLDGRILKITLERAEDLLCVEVAQMPCRRGRRVGVLAPDDQVGEAEVLAVDWRASPPLRAA